MAALTPVQPIQEPLELEFVQIVHDPLNHAGDKHQEFCALRINRITTSFREFCIAKIEERCAPGWPDPTLYQLYALLPICRAPASAGWQA
ncbi:MAG: hypothetical protein ACR2IK_10435 [Chloroflexota bacterium]